MSTYIGTVRVGTDVIDWINAYEAGELTQDQIVELFSLLVRTGMIHHLQGSYLREAFRLFQNGQLTLAGEVRSREVS